MFTEVLSSIVNPLITISAILVAVLVIGQIVKRAIIKSAKIAVDNVAEDKINDAFKIFNIVATSTAIISIIVFALFMSNWAAKSEYQVDKIEQAPLPENFKEPTRAEIEVSNEEAVTKVSKKKEKEATEANDKAMEEASKLFNSVE